MTFEAETPHAGASQRVALPDDGRNADAGNNETENTMKASKQLGKAVTIPAPLGPLVSGWVEIRHDDGGDYPREAAYVLTVSLTAPGGKPLREERAFGGKIHAQCAAKGAVVRLSMAPGDLTPHNPYRRSYSLGSRAAANAWGNGYSAACDLLRQVQP